MTKESFFMVPAIPNSPRRDSSSFQKVVDAFLSAEGLPFAEILPATRIEGIFRNHSGLFGLQVAGDGAMRSLNDAAGIQHDLRRSC
jgi:hypothetical protein